jgi:hypothetical protein
VPDFPKSFGWKERHQLDRYLDYRLHLHLVTIAELEKQFDQAFDSLEEGNQAWRDLEN